MKFYTLFLIALVSGILLSAGCKKLDNVKLNDNPYDHDYVGPKVISINSITSTFDTIAHVCTNYLHYSGDRSIADGINVYRNGTLVKSLTGYSIVWGYWYNPSVQLSDLSLKFSAIKGKTYSYQLSFTKGGGETVLSEPFSYTIP